MNIYEAFLYEWTNTKNGMKYIGYHKGSIDDGYICSSKPMLSDYNQTTEAFERRILAFGSKEEMVELERSTLKKLDAKRNPLYYNQQNGNGKVLFDSHNEETKRKMSISKLGRQLSDHHKKRISEGMTGYKKTKSHIENHKKKLKGTQHSQEWCNKISEGMKRAWEDRKRQKTKYSKEINNLYKE